MNKIKAMIDKIAKYVLLIGGISLIVSGSYSFVTKLIADQSPSQYLFVICTGILGIKWSKEIK
jgi:hypothetical protein